MTLHSDPVQAASLLRMANQIARNLEHRHVELAERALLEHLREFWTADMRRELFHHRAQGASLHPIVESALDRLDDAEPRRPSAVGEVREC